MTATEKSVVSFRFHKPLRILAIGLYCILAATQFVQLYLGESSFQTTIFLYSIPALFTGVLLKTKVLPVNYALSILVFIAALFTAEVALRFVFKYPLTYTEKNGNGYVSYSRTTRYENFYYLKIKRRKDLHTLEFEPFEVRSVANVEGNGYPDETYNAIGTRGELPASGKKIVLALGDSFTEGVGVRVADSYPFRLEKLLQAADTSFAVLNAGISGNDPFYDWKMLQKLSARFTIHTVVFLVNSTDLFEISYRGGNERFLPDGSLRFKDAPWWEPLYAVSYIFRLFIHHAGGLDYAFLMPAQAEQVKTQSLHALTSLFEEHIAPFCSQRNIQLFVALHPLESEAARDMDDYQAIQKALSSFREIESIDCTAPVRIALKSEALFYQTDGHFREAGYNIIAETVARKLLGKN